MDLKSKRCSGLALANYICMYNSGCPVWGTTALLESVKLSWVHLMWKHLCYLSLGSSGYHTWRRKKKKKYNWDDLPMSTNSQMHGWVRDWTWTKFQNQDFPNSALWKFSAGKSFLMGNVLCVAAYYAVCRHSWPLPNRCQWCNQSFSVSPGGGVGN